MATQYDTKIFYLSMDYKKTMLQMNDLENQIIEDNKNLLAIMTTEEKEDFIYNELLERLKAGTDSNNTLEPQVIDNNINTESREYENNKRGGKIMLISHPEIIKNIDGGTYNTYASMMANSNFEYANVDDGTMEEYWNYIRKRGAKQVILDFMNEAEKEFKDGKVPAPRTVERHIKKMLENDIPLAKVENHNGKVYYRLLNHIGKGYFRAIPYRKVRELVISTNSNMLKLYVYMEYLCDEENYTPVDRKHLAEKLGLSTNSTRGLDGIGTMLTSLCNLGFLERLQEDIPSRNEKGEFYIKTTYKYRVTTLAEYEEAKMRGTIKNNNRGQ